MSKTDDSPYKNLCPVAKVCSTCTAKIVAMVQQTFVEHVQQTFAEHVLYLNFYHANEVCGKRLQHMCCKGCGTSVAKVYYISDLVALV